VREHFGFLPGAQANTFYDVRKRHGKNTKNKLLKIKTMEKFSKVIECLKNGGSARRLAWNENNEIVMQIPQCIDKTIVPKMTSLPAGIKSMIGTVGSGEISYHDQVLIVTFVDDESTPASGFYSAKIRLF
jgi:hypothetical protein